ncbi:MAG: biopolymer transporter ExbD [Bacteroidota bacterium]
MDLKSKHKINASFSMSSMTDIIFLLLIFFMLTSSFITPSGLPVNLPSAKATEIQLQKVSVTITDDLKYYINDQLVNREKLESRLRSELSSGEGLVTLHCDAKVPVENLVEVAGIASSLKAKVSIAAKPK